MTVCCLSYPSSWPLSVPFLACVEASGVNAIAGCLDLFFVSLCFLGRDGFFQMARRPDLTNHVMFKESLVSFL